LREGNPIELPLVSPIHTNIDAFESDEPVADHLIEGGENRFDFVVCVNTFDDDGEVYGKAEDVRGVKPAGLAESLDPLRTVAPARPLRLSTSTMAW
jgi:hypothetical protein